MTALALFDNLAHLSVQNQFGRDLAVPAQQS
jgi:hypothetical protein